LNENVLDGMSFRLVSSSQHAQVFQVCDISCFRVVMWCSVVGGGGRVDRGWFSSKRSVRKARMYLIDDARLGGGNELGHVVAVDWKDGMRKVKDHVSVRWRVVVVRSVGGERRGELVACVSTVSSESIKGNREGRVARK
jgi:hypothetical protein